MLKIVFLFLMAGGLPVAIAMAGASLVYLFWDQTTPPFVVIHRMVSGIDSFPLLAVPFFILAGNLMNNAGITNRIYNFALALVGWLKGGLGHVNVLGSVIFAGMSGTAIADAAGLGTIEIKAMQDHGYSTEFAVGVTAASATLGPDHSAEPAVRDLRDDGQRQRRRAVPRGHPAGRADGHPDDAHRGLLRAQERLGRATSSSTGTRLFKALAETGRGDRLAAGAVAAGGQGRLAAAGHGVRRTGRRCSSPTRYFNFQAVLPDHDAGAADRRHDHRPVHADRRRDRRLRLGHGAGLRLVQARSPGRCSSRSASTRWRPPPPCCSSSRPPASSAGC